MFRLYGYFTQNSMKTLYLLEELGCDYEFVFVDYGKGEQYRVIDLLIDGYENVQAWFDRIESRKSIANARARLPQ